MKVKFKDETEYLVNINPEMKFTATCEQSTCSPVTEVPLPTAPKTLTPLRRSKLGLEPMFGAYTKENDREAYFPLSQQALFIQFLIM